MHTTQCGDTLFIHHGDYSGPIQVSKVDENHDPFLREDRIAMAIEFADLQEFVIGKLASDLISHIEDDPDKAVLSFLPFKPRETS